MMTPEFEVFHRSLLMAACFACLLAAGCATGPALVGPSALPSHPALPDPLVMADGRPVASPDQWLKQRRPELKTLFEQYMYGRIPAKPVHEKMSVVAEYPDFLDGQATLKLVSIEADPNAAARAGRWPNRTAWGREWSNDANGTPSLAFGSDSVGADVAPYPSPPPLAPRIDLMLIIPKSTGGSGAHAPASKPPVFLAMNFCGNQALTPDARVPLAHGWLASSCPGCSDNTATETTRGMQAADWPLAEIVRRGYALAAFYSGDIDSDRKDVSDGLYAWLAKGDAARNEPASRGTIAAWAWGFERCVDYLATDRDIDSSRIAAVGHSRNGKAALLAAAFDERIAMAFPHQAGCGGTAPSRGKTGESVKAINDQFPHWFNAAFKQFNDAPDRLPIDQNCLVALCAPRPVLISAGQADQWSNPDGQFQVVQAADSVYRFLGAEAATNCQLPALASGAPAAPPLCQFVGGHLAYYLREGKHSMTPVDWTMFMDFADKQWRH